MKYLISRNSLGIVDAINRDDGASIPYLANTKSFDEENPLVIELRKWEKENGELDLSIQPEPPPPLEWIRQQQIELLIREAATLQDALVADYASAERDSWDVKMEQARKFLETGDLEDARYLKVEAIATTGVTNRADLVGIVKVLSGKIIRKADELLTASATIAGKRNRLVSAVEGSEDIDFIKSLNFDAEI